MRQDSVTFNHKKVVNIYIVYEISKTININDYPTFENLFPWCSQINKTCWCLLYKYLGYVIGFDRKGSYSVGNEVGRNVIVFRADMSLSSHIDNKKKDILILDKGPR